MDVVVVAYRSAHTLGACLEATGRIEGLGRVVVVDHGQDGSADLAGALGADVLHDPSNPGFGAGQNHGVARTAAPFVLLCNPDAVVEPEAIAGGCRFLEDRPEVGALQGVVLGPNGLPERSQGVSLGPLHLWGRALGMRRLLRWRPVRLICRHSAVLRDHGARVPAGPADAESLAATALLVRRTAFDDVGGFDESYFLYGEDLDLCRRLRAGGHRLVALPDVWARHQNGASSTSSAERELHWWRGTMGYAARWWSTGWWVAALGAALVRWARLVVIRPRSAARTWRMLVSGPRGDRRQRRRR